MSLSNLIKETIRGWFPKHIKPTNPLQDYKSIIANTVPYKEDQDWWALRVRLLVYFGGSYRKF